MCGIAGYSIRPESSVNRTLAAQALLAGIAERGADAVGYAHRGAGAVVTVHKRRSGASGLLDEVHVPTPLRTGARARPGLHEGPSHGRAEQPPIRHRAVVGIHNRIIVNDEEIFARYGFGRAHPEMTVDSEAIFALGEHTDARAEALEELRAPWRPRGWTNARPRPSSSPARSAGRSGSEPRRRIFFASTRAALEVLEGTIRITLRKREVGEGTLLRAATGTWRARVPAGSVARRGDDPPPSVRAPHEGASCLQRLAAIALAAA